MARRNFSREFKLEAVRLVEERGVTVAQAVRDLDIHNDVLRRWVRQFRDDPAHAFPGAGQMKSEQSEIAQLKKEIRKLKAERDILKKSRGLLRKGLIVKFEFIAKHRGIWPVTWMCGVLDVSPSGFYSWRSRPPSDRTVYDEILIRDIRRSFSASGATYGVHRIWLDLLDWGHDVGRERVARLVRSLKLLAQPKRRKRPADKGQRLESAIAPNSLDREFTATSPNQKWLTLPTSGPQKVGCTLLQRLICSRIGSLAGR